MDRRERLGIYRTHFTVSKEVLEKDIVEMVFNGLDTYATIFINDYQVLSTENFHRTYKLDCKQWLNEGNNTLRIIFKSGGVMVLNRLFVGGNQ